MRKQTEERIRAKGSIHDEPPKQDGKPNGAGGRKANGPDTDFGADRWPDGGGERKAPPMPPLINCKELSMLDIKPIRWVVPGYVAEGLTLLAGKAKIGKSWLVLEIAIAVAMQRCCLGEVLCTGGGHVLYLALEDNFRRLKQRTEKLSRETDKGKMPENLTFATQWPRVSEGGLELLEKFVSEHSDTRLIIIDVLGKIRAVTKSRDQTQYAADYAALEGLQRLAARHSIAIVVVHHTRKQAGYSDALDKVSGTVGLIGAADTALVLDKDNTGAFTLHGRGRDVEEIDAAIRFMKDSCRWTVTGKASEIRQTSQRIVILDALKQAGEPMTASEIAVEIGQKTANVSRTAQRMVRTGDLRRKGRGRYEPTPFEDRVRQADGGD